MKLKELKGFHIEFTCSNYIVRTLGTIFLWYRLLEERDLALYLKFR
jgi:hypothetical protein